MLKRKIHQQQMTALYDLIPSKSITVKPYHLPNVRIEFMPPTLPLPTSLTFFLRKNEKISPNKIFPNKYPIIANTNVISTV